MAALSHVMTALVAVIHASRQTNALAAKPWMAGTRPAMTGWGNTPLWSAGLRRAVPASGQPFIARHPIHHYGRSHPRHDRPCGGHPRLTTNHRASRTAEDGRYTTCHDGVGKYASEERWPSAHGTCLRPALNTPPKARNTYMLFIDPYSPIG
jgi:hypothetical protein